MKENELMIGDWITSKKWRENPFKLSRINDNGKYYYGITSDGTQVGPFLIEEIKPIPLTAEILEKNGAFKNLLMGEQRHFIYNIGGFELLAIYDADFSFQINGGARKMKYVHELQHALKLCGIEKEIIL